MKLLAAFTPPATDAAIAAREEGGASRGRSPERTRRPRFGFAFLLLFSLGLARSLASFRRRRGGGEMY